MPIVPAYLLFKALPSSADVSGPLQGLKLKLGGAFAGYFVLLIFTFTQLPQVRRFAAPETHQVWTVEGNLQDDQGNGVLVGPKTTFVTNLSQTAEADFPRLWIGHTGYPPRDIPLDPELLKQQRLEEKRNESNHTIILKTVILRKSAEPYDPATTKQPVEVNPQTYLKSIGKSGTGSGGAGQP